MRRPYVSLQCSEHQASRDADVVNGGAYAVEARRVFDSSAALSSMLLATAARSAGDVAAASRSALRHAPSLHATRSWNRAVSSSVVPCTWAVATLGSNRRA